MIFKKIEPSSYKEIKKYISLQGSKACEFSFGILYIWKDYFNFKYAIYNDYLFIKEESQEEVAFFLPVGKDIKEGLNILIDYCKSVGDDLILDCVPEYYINNVKDYLKIEPIELCIWNDYLYDAYKMSSYSGKKMSKKRNHFNKFIKEYPNYSIELINNDNINQVMSFYDLFKENNKKDYDLYKYEESNLQRVFTNYSNLPFIGMILKDEEKIIAFTIGEIVNDVLMVHIEKANRDYDGSFPTVQKLFASYCLQEYNIKYINREDDAGDEGLRKSKLSYYPISIIKKYRVHYKIK